MSYVFEVRKAEERPSIDVILLGSSSEKKSLGYLSERVNTAVRRVKGPAVIMGETSLLRFLYRNPEPEQSGLISEAIGDSTLLIGRYYFHGTSFHKLTNLPGDTVGEGNLSFRMGAYHRIGKGIDYCFVSANDILPSRVQQQEATIVVLDGLKGVRHLGARSSPWVRVRDASMLDTAVLIHHYIRM